MRNIKRLFILKGSNASLSWESTICRPMCMGVYMCHSVYVYVYVYNVYMGLINTFRKQNIMSDVCK